MAASKRQIFVRLIDEGTEVWRPVDALEISPGVYRLIGHHPQDELWQFEPGETVLCREKANPGGAPVEVAVELADLP